MLRICVIKRVIANLYTQMGRICTYIGLVIAKVVTRFVVELVKPNFP